MLENIYVCRHGFRSNWGAENPHMSPTGVRLDHPLSAHGHVQAADLSTFLSDPARTAPYPVPERIVSSPFYRCIATAAPTARALKLPIAIDHGVAEWYAPARGGTGLHPRPAPNGPADVLRFFPLSTFDHDYASTNFPDRRGERMQDLFRRIDTFVDAFIGRMDAAGVKTVVIFAHAATVIALGRALTGDRRRDFVAGCATTSLYCRNNGGRLQSWECVYTGKADYMPGGVERDWDFGQVELPNGEVVMDEGDHEDHAPEDELPVGLNSGMERYLSDGFKRGMGVREETREKGVLAKL